MPIDQPVVLDTSVLVALMLGEPGAELVRQSLPKAIVSTVNLAESIEVVSRKGHLTDRSRSLLQRARLEPFDKGQAVLAGDLLCRYRRSNNISLGDACCLALGMSLGAEVLTCDRNWAALQLGIPVRMIR